MYGCYKINFLDKNKKTKQTIYQKNNITDEGKKKILDMLSFNPVGSYGYKIAEKIHEGSFQLNGKTCKYKTSFFDWGVVNHPFNKTGNSTKLYESEIAKNVLTENYSLSEKQADRILNPQNNLRVDWGKNKSYTSENLTGGGGYGLDSYKVWFNVSFGTVEQTEKFVLPIPNDPEFEKYDFFEYEKDENQKPIIPDGITLVNADGEIKLLGHKIFKGTVSVKSIIGNNFKNYNEGSDYQVDYDNGKIIITTDMRKNLYDDSDSSVSGNEIIRNEIEISYKWCGAEYIEELKNGICGVYVNAQPSIKNNSSSYGNKNYFGMGTFSCDCGETWGGYSFPWKGQPLEGLEKISVSATEGKNLTSFYALNTEYEHYFPTFPYVFINPTNFIFAFCSDGNNSFHIKNLNFLIPNFPPPTLQEIELISESGDSVKKQIEWAGMGEDEENGIYAEWKTYIDINEGNEIVFDEIRTYFTEEMKNSKPGWQEIEYPDNGDVVFSVAPIELSKNQDELIEISYRIYFNEGTI